MIGLPARGKSTVAHKLRDSLKSDGIRTRIFNNGDLRWRLSKENTSCPEFFDPRNRTGASLRERYAVMNLNHAMSFIDKGPPGRKVAIIDASNVSLKRRKMLIHTLPEDKVLFIECLNDDEILDANIRCKVDIPEFAHLTESEAVDSFKKRIRYYEGIYQPLKRERNYFKLDTFNYRILKEKLTDRLPFEDRIRDFLVTPYIKNLYLIRHTESFYNLENRIGGDSDLTPRGQAQAEALARHFGGKRIPLIFTSGLLRTIQTATPICRTQKHCRVLSLTDFNEIDSGICDRMTYEEIRLKHPKIRRRSEAQKVPLSVPWGRRLRLHGEEDLARHQGGDLSEQALGQHHDRGPPCRQPHAPVVLRLQAQGGRPLHLHAAGQLLSHLYQPEQEGVRAQEFLMTEDKSRRVSHSGGICSNGESVTIACAGPPQSEVGRIRQ
jgi:hypothetical protein